MLTVTEALIRSFCSFSIGFVFVTLISSLTTVRQSEKIFSVFQFGAFGRFSRILATLSKQFSAKGKKLKED